MVHILCNNVLKDKKMSLNYSPKCPGPDRILSTFPENYTCPDCGSNVEIWTDEKKGSCPDCGRIIRKESLQADDETEPDLKELIRLACSLGGGELPRRFGFTPSHPGNLVGGLVLLHMGRKTFAHRSTMGKVCAWVTRSFLPMGRGVCKR